MREGEFADGAHVLRAKIDLASPNMLMRDPVLYRIRHADHYRTGGDWCIYPLYDFTHCLSDSIEGITHSLCTLEFDNNREVYDWILDHVDVPRPQPRQYEFARLNLEYTLLSKRKLLRLVEEGHVHGWDDPRMPTVAGMRRRGIPSAALRTFCDMIGVAKTENRVDFAKLEYAIRDELNPSAPRVMCVLRPLKLVVDNFPEGELEELQAPYFPKDIGKEGSRLVPFTRELLIERDDFEEDPPKGFRRLVPGEEVRLRYGYVVRCVDVVRDENGVILEVHCTYDPDTKGGSTPDGRGVKGTIHWVSESHSLPAEIRLYDRLFSVPDPDHVEDAEDFTLHLNPNSLTVLTDSRIERSIASDSPRHHVSVRENRLLRSRRCRLQAGPPGLQPYRDAPGQLGKGSKGGGKWSVEASGGSGRKGNGGISAVQGSGGGARRDELGRTGDPPTPEGSRSRSAVRRAARVAPFGHERGIRIGAGRRAARAFSTRGWSTQSTTAGSPNGS